MDLSGQGEARDIRRAEGAEGSDHGKSQQVDETDEDLDDDDDDEVALLARSKKRDALSQSLIGAHSRESTVGDFGERCLLDQTCASESRISSAVTEVNLSAANLPA